MENLQVNDSVIMMGAVKKHYNKGDIGTIIYIDPTCKEASYQVQFKNERTFVMTYHVSLYALGNKSLIWRFFNTGIES